VPEFKRTGRPQLAALKKMIRSMAGGPVSGFSAKRAAFSS